MKLVYKAGILRSRRESSRLGCGRSSGGSCRAATAHAGAAGTLRWGRFLAHERFRRLTLRSATGFSQREKHHRSLARQAGWSGESCRAGTNHSRIVRRSRTNQEAQRQVMESYTGQSVATPQSDRCAVNVWSQRDQTHQPLSSKP